MKQPSLFGQDLVPLRKLVYEAKLQRMRVHAKGRKYTTGLEVAVDNLTRAVEALLDGDQVKLAMACITPKEALAFSERIKKGIGRKETR